jgi:hypothetical protein
LHAGVPKQNFGLAAPDVPPQYKPPPAHQASALAPAPPSYTHPSSHAPASLQAPGHAEQVTAASGTQKQPRAAGCTAKQKLSVKEKEAAKKLAKQVVSALNFDDTHSAVDLLQQALALLTE